MSQSQRSWTTKRKTIWTIPVPRSRGVTLLEVIFSIGVMLVGLVGLVSILPIAGQRGRDSISLTVGSNLALNTVRMLETEKYLSAGLLRPLPADTGTAVTNLNITTGPVPAFTIDPLFVSSASVPAPPTGLVNGYEQSFFPYYKLNQSPLVDPSDAATSQTWPTFQPRLSRVGVTEATVPTIFINQSSAFALAETSDDLIVDRPQDRSLSANFKNSSLTATSGGLSYGKRISSGKYTWFATVDPMPDNVHASVTVVTLDSRERTFEVPTRTTAVDRADLNAVSERLGYISFGSGFRGGAGGLVHVVASASVDDEVRPGSWLMMSRITPSGAVHRWYRVVSNGGKPEYFQTDGDTTTDDSNLGCRLPAGASRSVWRRKLLLDGPDWSFAFAEGSTARQYADSSFGGNTYVTLVPGVVSVVEETIRMSNF